MIYKFQILLFLLFSISTKSQNSLYSIPKHRLLFDKNTDALQSDINRLVINGDTLYYYNRKNSDYAHLNHNNYNSKNILQDYQYIIFDVKYYYSKNYELKQWNDIITIYFDKDIPKKIAKSFTEFYSNLNDVKNLKIKFTKNINKANLYIKPIYSKLKVKNDSIYNVGESKTDILLNGTYHLNTDLNNKFSDGVLEINVSLKDQDKLLKQLKQLFFMSLGDFNIYFTENSESILNKDYVNNETLSEYDIELLKMHYSKIYDFRINQLIFNKLISLAYKNK